MVFFQDQRMTLLARLNIAVQDPCFLPAIPQVLIQVIWGPVSYAERFSPYYSGMAPPRRLNDYIDLPLDHSPFRLPSTSLNFSHHDR
jgi:hypothetical protein